MQFYRRNPVFYTLLFCILCGCLAGLWYLQRISKELSVLKASYESKSAQYDRYLKARPSPTQTNLEAIQLNYESLYEVYQTAMRALNLNTFDRAEFFGATPKSRADWSFELHRFKENARYAALSNGVALPSVVEFGFEGYADGGPPPENMKEVHEQIVILSALLDTLFSSGISSFAKVERGERPGANKRTTNSKRPASSLFGEGDRFLVTEGQSLAVPGTIDSYVFRIAFRGQSNALRSFLNQVIDSDLPYVVRGVEVDLASEGGAKAGLENLAVNPFAKNDGNGAAAGVPIISDNTSLFVVTVEFLDLVVNVTEPQPIEVGNAEEEGSDV